MRMMTYKSKHWLGTGNLKVMGETHQIGSLVGNPIALDNVHSLYPMPHQVISTCVGWVSIGYGKFLQWMDYMGDGPIGVPCCFPSFQYGHIIHTTCNHQEKS